MKSIPSLLVLLIALQPSSMNAVPTRKAAIIFTSVVLAAGANGVHSYKKNTAKINELISNKDREMGAFYDREFYDWKLQRAKEQRTSGIYVTGIIGSIAVGGTAFYLYKRLPSTRLRKALQQLEEATQDRFHPQSLMYNNLHTLPSAQTFLDHVYKINIVEAWPYMSAFTELQRLHRQLDHARYELHLAWNDFNADKRTESMKQCDNGYKQITTYLGDTEERLRWIKQLPDYAERRERYDRVEAAKRQARAAEQQAAAAESAATSAAIIAGASMAHVISNHSHK